MKLIHKTSDEIPELLNEVRRLREEMAALAEKRPVIARTKGR